MTLILAMDDPVLIEPGTADRWAEDRQYARHHAGAAWDAFGRRRDETLALLRGLMPRPVEARGSSSSRRAGRRSMAC